MANEQQYKLFTKFIATRGVEEYRSTISQCIQANDSILELGCEWGTTSAFLFAKCKNLIATDISTECLQRARQKHPQINFQTLDAFDISSALKFHTKFTKIYFDLSGFSVYRSLLDVISMLHMYASVFQPEIIVIKSGSLKQFAKNCVAWKGSL